MFEDDLHVIIYCQGIKYFISGTDSIFNLVISIEAINFHLKPFPSLNIWALKTG